MFGQLDSTELRTGLTLASVIAFRMLGLFMILPVFMLLAADIPGFTPAKAGFAVGVYGLTQAILQQPFGKLSDRFGRRPVMLAGLARPPARILPGASNTSMPTGCGTIWVTLVKASLWGTLTQVSM